MSSQVSESPAGDHPIHHESGDQPAYWGGVFAMTLCVFALIASEFMPVSLLTPIAVPMVISQGIYAAMIFTDRYCMSMVSPSWRRHVPQEWTGTAARIAE